MKQGPQRDDADIIRRLSAECNGLRLELEAVEMRHEGVVGEARSERDAARAAAKDATEMATMLRGVVNVFLSLLASGERMSADLGEQVTRPEWMIRAAGLRAVAG